MAIAHKFEVTDMVDLIEDEFVTTLTIDNAINMLQFADRYGLSRLKAAAMDIMVSNCTRVFRMEGLPSLLGEQLCSDLFAYLASNCTVASNTVKEKSSHVRLASPFPSITVATQSAVHQQMHDDDDDDNSDYQSEYYVEY